MENAESESKPLVLEDRLEENPVPLQTHPSTSDSVIIWQESTVKFRESAFAEALELLLSAPFPTAKMLFNMAQLFARNNDYYYASQYHALALNNDPFLAVSFFGLGIAMYQLDLYEDAIQSWMTALERMRENDFIDYSQIGMPYKLWRCEIEFNLSQAHQCLEDTGSASNFRKLAAEHAKTTDQVEITTSAMRLDHSYETNGLDSIDSTDHLFTIPLGQIFEPPASLLARYNTKKDFLAQKAKLVLRSQTKTNRADKDFIGFSGDFLTKLGTMARHRLYVTSNCSSQTAISEWTRSMVFTSIFFLFIGTILGFLSPYPTFSFSPSIDPFLGPVVPYGPTNRTVDASGNEVSVSADCLALYSPVYNLTYPTPLYMMMLEDGCGTGVYQPFPFAPAVAITGPSLPLSLFVALFVGGVCVWIEWMGIGRDRSGFVGRGVGYVVSGFYLMNQLSNVVPGTFLVLSGLAVWGDLILKDMRDAWD